MTVVFDFVDPGSYLVQEILYPWEEDPDQADRRVNWLPLELRPPPSELISPDEAGWAALLQAMKEEATRLDLPFSPPDFVPWTRKAHELVFHLREVESDSAARQMIHRIFRAYFQDGLDLGRVDILVSLVDAAGFDAAEARTVLGVDRFQEAVEGARSEALERDFRGVPTLLLGNSRRLEGYHGPEELNAFLADQ
jgi:predicted DsbA family dithiol-disulfide isomerase